MSNKQLKLPLTQSGTLEEAAFREQQLLEQIESLKAELEKTQFELFCATSDIEHLQEEIESLKIKHTIEQATAIALTDDSITDADLLEDVTLLYGTPKQEEKAPKNHECDISKLLEQTEAIVTGTPETNTAKIDKDFDLLYGTPPKPRNV